MKNWFYFIVLFLVAISAACGEVESNSNPLTGQTEGTAKVETETTQTKPAFIVKPPMPAEPPSREEVVLRKDALNEEQWQMFFNQRMVRNVTRPSVYPVLPAEGKSRGQAIIVVPGGGYNFISTENEGFSVADKLAEDGYHAFVLKYRTFSTPKDPEGFLKQTSKAFRNLGKGPLPNHPPAVDDLALAITHLRETCSDYGCDPNNIGVIGFSAGARTLIRVIENKAEAEHISHAALLYPPMTTKMTSGPRPPMFLAIAIDDPLFKQGNLNMLEHLLSETDDIEFHLYANGGHGFGTRKLNTTASDWYRHYTNWLEHSEGIK